MLFFVLILFFSCLFLILISKVEIRIIMDNTTSIYLSFLFFSFNIRKSKKKKGNSEKNSTQGSYLKKLAKDHRLLKHLEITLNKIIIPQKQNDFTPKSILALYRICAVIFSLISYLESQSKEMTITNDAISCSIGADGFCLDFSLKFRLFSSFPFLYDYFKHRIKQKFLGVKACRKTK